MYNNILDISVWFRILIFLTFFTPTHGLATDLPDMGNSADALLSPADEKKLGKEFMRSVRAALPLNYDPLNSEYIQHLGERLASQIDTSQRSYKFFIIMDSSINAFAGPDGHIGINSGLITSTKHEGELASVVGHEIAHVEQRHLVRSFEASQKLSLPALAAIIAAVLLGKGNGDLTGAIIASTMAGMSQQQLSFSRQHEQEADRVGIKMLAGAGYDPHDMANFFEILEKSTRLAYSGEIPEFLLTHPVTISRISDARSRASQMNPEPVDTINNDKMYYELIRARLAITMLVNDKKLAQLQSLLKTPNETPTDHYTDVLVLFSQGNLKKAKMELEELIKNDRKRLPYLVTQAELDLASKDYGIAATHLQSSLLLYPDNISLTLLYAKYLIETEKPKLAMKVLLEQIRKTRQPQGSLYRLYAKAAKEAGETSEEHESLAEYYYFYGQLHRSIMHMQLALNNNKRDEFRKLRLTARLDEIKKEVIDNQEDNKGDERN